MYVCMYIYVYIPTDILSQGIFFLLNGWVSCFAHQSVFHLHVHDVYTYMSNMNVNIYVCVTNVPEFLCRLQDVRHINPCQCWSLDGYSSSISPPKSEHIKIQTCSVLRYNVRWKHIYNSVDMYVCMKALTFCSGNASCSDSSMLLGARLWRYWNCRCAFATDTFICIRHTYIWVNVYSIFTCIYTFITFIRTWRSCTWTGNRIIRLFSAMALEETRKLYTYDNMPINYTFTYTYIYI